jgi:S-adenosylmethionine:tRNA ribosyltransferase-isomerase
MANSVAHSSISRILPNMFQLKDYTYSLPPELIAQEAVHPHHSARLMVISKESEIILEEATFWDLDRIIPENRVLYLNNSRVQKARIRLLSTQYEKEDGSMGVIEDGEILFTKKRNHTAFECLVRPGKKFKIGYKIHFQKWYAVVTWETPSGRILETHGTTIEEIMEVYGELPLPPYIEYKKEKELDYQTSFASKDGSVAAPTASLHFTKELLEKLPHERQFLTLHVWLWTFKGIDTEDVRDYQIHSETVEIDASLFETITKEKREGKIILAIGTTSCRSLESLPHLWVSLAPSFKEQMNKETYEYWNELSKEIIDAQVENININNNTIQFQAKIYIYPGIPFRVVDELITNFHLPESSLLLLVGAFVSRERIMNIYTEAIKKRYRFFSFGDGMYVKKS